MKRITCADATFPSFFFANKKEILNFASGTRMKTTNTIAQAMTVTPSVITPVDALWTLIQSQTKTVRKALAKRLLDEELTTKAKQEAMVKGSLTKAFSELHSGKTKHNARTLFAH